MNERPIIFSGAMVRSIIDGRKTQTRRVVGGLSKRFPLVNLAEYARPGMPAFSGKPDDPWSWGYAFAEDGAHMPLPDRLPFGPFGTAGDRLWVRETFCDARQAAAGRILYKASDDAACRWTPAIHMPREACRLVLEVAQVRVQRVQEISSDDAIDEGIEPSDVGDAREEDAFNITAYAELWDSLNKKRGFGWDVNPWVWVVDFKRA